MVAPYNCMAAYRNSDMPDTRHPLIDEIRASSRRMVRELGFMQTTLAATDYPPSAVHALLEIAARQTMSSVQLVDFLGLEKSSVSRLVRKLVAAGELQEAAAGSDARLKPLVLTEQGRRTVLAIHAFARKRVQAALQHLPPERHGAVLQGLTSYADALQLSRPGSVSAHETSAAIAIESGCLPGAIGRITQMHAEFYASHAGFGVFFESQVAGGLADFARRLQRPGNRWWLAVMDGRVVGSVAIDGENHAADGAHLRWFIADDVVRGRGVGRRLLDAALAFCDASGFESVYLWTFRGLDAARRLYESAGFECLQEQPGEQWGAEVFEQRFVRRRSTVAR